MLKGEAVEILSNAGFQERDPNSVVNLARAKKSVRFSFIRAKDANAARNHCAAIEISRHVRGYLCRIHLKELFSQNDDNVEEPVPVIKELTQSRDVENEISMVTDPSSDISKPSVNISAHSEKEQKTSSNDIVKTISSDTTGYAATTDKTDGSLEADKSTLSGITSGTEGKESVKISSPKQIISKRDKLNHPSLQQTSIKRQYTRPQAATVIQKAWRRHIDMQVFRYYRDLINFRKQGSPALMLRCINPAEAKLLDAATGTHIKFRLAGDKFPPNIYYKIYTHRPVVDMCANSPKDYTNPDAKQATSKQIHTKNIIYPDTEKDGWYMRVENNGWRLVSDRLIHAAMDPTTWETSKKTVEFHHDKLVRKSDLERRRRQKKIAWMHKMYKQGMLQVKIEDSETSELVKKAADGLINTVDSHGPDGVMDWEVDELLQWTTALNFDDYLEGWKETATSNISEYEVEEMISAKASKSNIALEMQYDPYPPYPDLSINKKERPTSYTAMQVEQPLPNS
uniref:protein MFI-like n=1 Tax=Styela clava TaxID=7725 RepID=UPI00193AA6CE|nr:protein MFI-like [Styela clava]